MAHHSLGWLDADVSADAQVLNVVPLYVKGKTHLDPMVVATSSITIQLQVVSGDKFMGNIIIEHYNFC